MTTTQPSVGAWEWGRRTGWQSEEINTLFSILLPKAIQRTQQPEIMVHRDPARRPSISGLACGGGRNWWGMAAHETESGCQCAHSGGIGEKYYGDCFPFLLAVAAAWYHSTSRCRKDESSNRCAREPPYAVTRYRRFSPETPKASA